MKLFKITTLLLIVLLSFSACSSKKEIQEYNKPAMYWYNKMINQIAKYNLDDADDTYISLESEHKNSPLVPTALMLLAQAHMDEEEYQMANFYFDEYIRKYAYSKNIDYIRYLKIKANFMAFKNQFREQELVTKTTKEIEKFMINFPRSPYIHLVQTMYARLYMSKALFDNEIAELYERTGKPKAAAFYKKRVEENWIQPKDIAAVEVPLYKRAFEGNLFGSNKAQKIQYEEPKKPWYKSIFQ
jgi:outer membrane protein assembly factor BamD